MESLCDLLFEISSEDRLRILVQLEKEELTITNLARKLSMSTQETSRHIPWLLEVGLTHKGADGLHSLTPYGELTLKQIEGLEFMSRHKGYFKTHILTSLPPKFVNRIGELAGCTYMDDVMVVFHNVERMIREAKEYVWRLTDRYLMMALPDLEAATDSGVEFRLLQSKNFEYPPDWPGPGVILRKARLEGTFTVRMSEGADVFMAMSEKEVAAVAFPTTSGRFDYLGFTSNDERAHGWCYDLFQYYWEGAKPLPEFT